MPLFAACTIANAIYVLFLGAMLLALPPVNGRAPAPGLEAAQTLGYLVHGGLSWCDHSNVERP